MYGKTLQEEYCAYCESVGHRPYQDVETVAAEVPDANAMARRLGLKPGRAQDSAAGERLAAHIRALRHGWRQQLPPRLANDAKRRAIADALSELPNAVRDQFVELAILYLGAQQSPSDFLLAADPRLGSVATAEMGKIVAASGATVFADNRLSWSTAHKYYLLARCFGQEFVSYDCVRYWSESRRAFDMVRLWQFLTEQQEWLGIDDDVMPTFLSVLAEQPYDPETLSSWANNTLPGYVDRACRAEKSYSVADPVRLILARVDRLANEPAQKLALAALGECGWSSNNAHSDLQGAVQELPQVRSVLREVLAAQDEDQQDNAARWLTRRPIGELEMPLRLAYLRTNTPLLRQRLGTALAATLRPQPHNDMTMLVQELGQIAHSAVARADCDAGSDCATHTDSRAQAGANDVVAEDSSATSVGAYVDLDRPQAWVDGASDRPLVVPLWLRMIPVPTVRLRPEYHAELGRTFPANVLRGLVYGAVGFRFQQRDPDVQFFANHCVAEDWQVFCAWAVSLWEELVVTAFAADPENEQETSWIGGLTTRILNTFRTSDPNRLKEASFDDVLEARGLLEFAFHGDPMQITLQLWRLLNQGIWDECDGADSAAGEVLQVLDRLGNSGSLATLYDLDPLWYFGSEDYCHFQGKEDIARAKHTSVHELRWCAIPELTLDQGGVFTWFDGFGHFSCSLDSGFTAVVGQTLAADCDTDAKSARWSRRVRRSTPAELQQFLWRIRVRLRSLFRDMAASGEHLMFADWQRRCCGQSLVRVATQQVVWLGWAGGEPIWFRLTDQGHLENVDGTSITAQLESVEIATCVNTPSTVITQWTTRLSQLGVTDFINQFGFAETPAAVLSEGFWRLGEWDTSRFVDAQVHMSVLDAWAYDHGFVEEGDIEYVCEYRRTLAGGRTVRLEIEGRTMPVEAGVTTEILGVSLTHQEESRTSGREDYPSEVLLQQIYTDLTQLFSDTAWCSPPGVRC